MLTSDLLIGDFGVKFDSLESYLTADVLALINGSEIMKEQIRAYKGDPTTTAVVLDLERPDSASYRVPSPANASARGDDGYAIFGANRLLTPVDFIRAVS